MASKGKSKDRLKLKGATHKAYKVLLKLIDPKYVTKDKQIPLSILQNAKGVAFISEIKGGFVFTGTVGTGCIIAKLPNGDWSGPSSVGTAGMGWGAQIGASSTDSVIILNTDAAVKAFSGQGQIKFGGNLSLAAGPVGRDASADVRAGDGGVAACYSYAHSRGAFAGISLQGSVVKSRDSDNAAFYGQKVTPTAILTGIVAPPHDEDVIALHKTMRVICNSETDDYEFRDSRTGSMRNEFDQSGSFSGSQPSMANDAHYAHPEYDQADDLGPTLAPSEAISYPTASPVGGDLPDGWQELKTADGQVYFWNEKENVTTWDRPNPPAPSPPPPPPPPPLQPSLSYSSSASYAAPSAPARAPAPTSAAAKDLSSELSRKLSLRQSGGTSDMAAAAAGYAASNPAAAQAAVKYAAANPNSTAAAARYAGADPVAANAAVNYAAANPAATAAAASMASAAASQASVARSPLPAATPVAAAPAAPQAMAAPPPINHSSRPAAAQPPVNNASRPVAPPIINSASRPVSYRASAASAAPASAAAAAAATPSVDDPQSIYTLEQVVNRQVPEADASRLEAYLSDSEFQNAFKMDRANWLALPKWKRDQQKKALNIY